MSDKLNKHFDDLNKSNDNRNWIKDRMILLAEIGSHAYGTNVETSDRDYKGVCIPPKEYFLGLKSFNEYNTTGGKNFRNTQDDIDVNVLHINKFVSDAVKGSPNNVELLFIDKERFILLDDFGEELVDNRHLFLSKNVKNKFGGFAKNQLRKMEKSNRKELVEKFGYDTKSFMHSVRLLTSAIEILETGDFSTKRPNSEFLLECRSGHFSFNQASKVVEDLEKEMISAYELSKIPNEPNYKKINKLLIDINERFLSIKK